MTEKILETLEQVQGENKHYKIVAVLETVVENLPTALGMMAKSQLNLAMRYVEDIPEEEIDKLVTDLHKIIFLIEGADYDTVIDADVFRAANPMRI